MARLDISLSGEQVDKLRDSMAAAGAAFEQLNAKLHYIVNQGFDIVFNQDFKKNTKLHIGLNDGEKQRAINALAVAAEDFDKLQRLLMEIENFRFRIDVPPNCQCLDVHFDPRCMFENIPLPWDRKPSGEAPKIAPLNLLSLTEEQNKTLTQRCAELLKECFVDATVERGYILGDRGNIMFRGRQLTRRDPVPHVLFADIRGGSIRIHYHPSTAWFSVEDLQSFQGSYNVRIEGVVCKDGSTHFIEKAPNYNKDLFGEALKKFKHTTTILGQNGKCGVNYYQEGKLLCSEK